MAINVTERKKKNQKIQEIQMSYIKKRKNLKNIPGKRKYYKKFHS